MNKEDLLKELEFCLRLWEEKGGCAFGRFTKCEDCAAPYLLLKFISGEIIHGKDSKRLSLEEWKNKYQELKDLD